MKLAKESIVKFSLYLLIIIFVLSACDGGTNTGPSYSTWTPSPSATPTCIPSELSTPIGWNPSSKLIILLFNPNSKNEGVLEYENGEKTQNITDFVLRIIPAIAKSGDQISAFQLGFRKYENARFLRIYSYTEVQKLYDTPSPNQTLTPIAIEITPLSGLPKVQATSLAMPILTAHAATSTALAIDDICKKQNWNESGLYTATSLAKTQLAEVATVNADVAGIATGIIDINNAETPYSSDVVYEGLYHASIDIRSDCEKYDRCILIIVDDLNTWTFENLGDFEIDLRGVDLVYSIMPNCKDINQPSCTKLQEFWAGEFKKYGIAQIPIFDNGIRAEQNLLDTIGR